MLSRDLGYVRKDKVEKPLTDIAEVARMLHALRMKVEGASQQKA